MKRIIFYVAVFFVAVNSFTGVASAYGGGPLFPPGYVAVVCTETTLHLPFGMTVQMPVCKPNQDNDFKQRLQDFIDRVIHGDTQ